MPACSLNHSLVALSVPLSHSVPSKPSVQVPLPPPPPLPSLSSTTITTKHSLNVAAVSVPQSSSPSLSIAIRNSSNVDSHSFATIAAVMMESFSLGKGAASSAEQLRLGEEDACLSRRRRRRMRKRKKSSAGAMPCDDDLGEDEDFGRLLVRGGRSSRSERSRRLTRRQEAEFSVYLKVGAMVEETDSLTRSSSSSSRRMERRRRKEKAWLRARECRERITLSYKRLVVTIAMPYQGKGLSLQDLIQVDPMFF